jgi:glycosyltransferase involved in cell wall biosynthesis
MADRAPGAGSDHDHNVVPMPGGRPGIPDRERVQRTRERRLRIAVLAPPWIPVSPTGCGGIEFVVAMSSDALVEQGHDVELFCAPGLSSKAKVHPLLEAPHSEKIERALFEADHVASALAAIDDAAGAAPPFDVLHVHCGYTTLAMTGRQSTSVVHTVHGPFHHDTSPYYARQGAKGRLVCISRSQAGTAPAEADVATVVYNPVDVDSRPVGYRKEDYALFMARMVEEKGPHINRQLIRYGGVREQRLSADAFAFLMPISWPEPFGLVMVEALAADTPVLAFAHGAAPEIIEHGVNGFPCQDEHEMAELVEQAAGLEPMRCRETGAERFAPDRVAAGYEDVYRTTLARAADRRRTRAPDA